MKVTALVENISHCELRAIHGLSLLVETEKHMMLFDVAEDGALLENAKTRNIDLSKVDTVILSHAHNDHTGSLADFLSINKTAKVYIQKAAFDPCYYKEDDGSMRPIGIDVKFMNHPQIVLVEGDLQIDEELFLFQADSIERYHSTANDRLYDQNGLDTFKHEQNLLISETTENNLIAGCCHSGIVNIMDKIGKYNPKTCIAGFHLVNPSNHKTVETEILDGIASELSKYDIMFYTCHCTGEEAFTYLSGKMKNIQYLSCGEILER
ncbi:MBL fold metallo-hydrolase [Chakrabartyella piscis]|uniref:MBL fold metallo-hydrolase n=1 Tax=Chakrabartyella piscis TaxID=2918914 RepID=UPI0029583408|nr:MBL fold metallo-hydrolase [Chakrabartyella piscis]